MYRPFRAKNIIKSLSQGCRPGLYAVSPSGFTSTYRNFNLVVAIHELPLHTVTKTFSTANVLVAWTETFWFNRGRLNQQSSTVHLLIRRLCGILKFPI